MAADHRLRLTEEAPSVLAARGIWLTARQALHERALLASVRALQDTPYVLKGGTGLAFCYRLDRHSTDIDLDGASAVDPDAAEERVRQGLADAEIRMSKFIVHRDTDTGQRFKVHYLDPGSGEDRLVNLDLSFRREPQDSELATIKDIRTYKIDRVFDQTLGTLRQRCQARDLHDLGFISERHGDRLSADQIRHAEEVSRDYEGLANFFAQAFKNDELLARPGAHEDAAIRFRVAIERQLALRGEPRSDQAIPAKVPVLKVLEAHGRWLATAGREGASADLSDTDLTGAILSGYRLASANLRGARLKGARLRGINLENADLEGTDFTEADLRFANLRGANLRGAVFDGAMLDLANLTGADMEGVTFQQTMLWQTKGLGEALAAARNADATDPPPPESLRPSREVDRDVRRPDWAPSR